MAKNLPPFDPFTDLPVRYEDRRTPIPVGKFNDGVPLLTVGIPKRLGRYGKVTAATMSGIGGLFYVKFFREMSPFHRMIFDPKKSGNVLIWGAPRKEHDNMWCFYHPAVLKRGDIGRIVPVYRTPKGVSRKKYRKHAEETARALAEGLHDEVPPEIFRKRGLKSISEALLDIHAPKEMPDDLPLMRLAYREIFETKKQVLFHRRSPAQAMEAGIAPFRERLPYTSTGNRLTTSEEPLSDMKSDRAMRILSGDIDLYETVANWVDEDIEASTMRPLPERV